jgi:hypothetical protein
MSSPERISEGKQYEVIDSTELVRRWVLPVSPLANLHFDTLFECHESF